MTARSLADTAVVYDSTADLPEGPGDGVTAIVPLRVMFGSETLLDYVDLDPAAFYRRLASDGSHPTTSQPPPAAFAEVYERAAAGARARRLAARLRQAVGHRRVGARGGRRLRRAASR